MSSEKPFLAQCDNRDWFPARCVEYSWRTPAVINATSRELVQYDKCVSEPDMPGLAFVNPSKDDIRGFYETIKGCSRGIMSLERCCLSPVPY